MHLARMFLSTPTNASSSRMSRGACLIGAAVMRGGGGQLRQGQGNRLFTPRSGAVRAAGQTFPDAVLLSFDAELVPLPIIERLGQMILPGAGVVGRAHGLDLLLQELAHCRAFGGRPGAARVQEQAAGFGEGLGQIGQRFPDEPERQASAHGPLGKLGVDLFLPAKGAVEQVVQMLGDLVDQIILEHFALTRVEQFLAFLNDRHHAVAQFGNRAGPALKLDADDENAVADRPFRHVTMRAQAGLAAFRNGCGFPFWFRLQDWSEWSTALKTVSIRRAKSTARSGDHGPGSSVTNSACATANWRVEAKATRLVMARPRSCSLALSSSLASSIRLRATAWLISFCRLSSSAWTLSIGPARTRSMACLRRSWI